MSRLCPVLAMMAVALPTPVIAAGMSNDALLSVLGPPSIRLIGAARIAGSFGTVTSGYRSIAHNKRVGGVPTSYHLVGRAIDVARRPGVSHHTIVVALQRAGFVLVESLDERDHSHFAFSNSIPFAPVSPTASIVPAMPPEPRVLADDHGVLLVASSPLAIGGELLPTK